MPNTTPKESQNYPLDKSVLPPKESQSLPLEKSASLEQVDKQPYWCAIIYNPKKESKDLIDVSSVDYNENRRPVPVYLRQIMLPPDTSSSSDPGFQYIELRPGANLQILYADWLRASTIPVVKPLIGLSIDVVAFSTAEDDKPGYRHFTSAEAQRLVKLTTASGWIDEWMDGEVRPEVIKAANERKAYLEAELAKRVA